MKNKIRVLMKTLLFLFIIFSFKVYPSSLPIGSALPSPDAKLRSTTGRSVSMGEVKKQNGLLVMFSCNTCPFVIRNQQRTKELCANAIANKIGVILINSNEGQREDEESFSAMKAYSKAQNYQWDYVLDKDNLLADEFAAKRTPECFLFNNKLTLTYHGAIDDSPGNEATVTHHYCKDAIAAQALGKEIAVKESRSVGCGIKRK